VLVWEDKLRGAGKESAVCVCVCVFEGKSLEVESVCLDGVKILSVELRGVEVLGIACRSRVFHREDQSCSSIVCSFSVGVITCKRARGATL
jgi:hypothetical protein